MPKKGKTLPQETLGLVQSFYEDDEYSRQMPGKKDYVSIDRNVHKQKHQNAVLLVDPIDWEYTYKDLIKKVVCDPDNKLCMMHCCESCPGSAALKKFLDDEISHLDMNSEFHYCQWQTTDYAALATLTTTFKEYKNSSSTSSTTLLNTTRT